MIDKLHSMIDKLHEARQLQLVQVTEGFLFCGLEGKTLVCPTRGLAVSTSREATGKTISR